MFQLLHGIRTDLQRQLVREGYRLRIYIPFGTHWFPYFIRRLVREEWMLEVEAIAAVPE